MNRTPSCTSGVPSLGPFGSDHVHATRRSPTFVLLIFFSGLKPCASYVRRYINHSPSGTRVSNPSVTGRILSSGLNLGGEGGTIAPAASPPPPALGQSGAAIAFSASGSPGRSAEPGRDPFSRSM